MAAPDPGLPATPQTSLPWPRPESACHGGLHLDLGWHRHSHGATEASRWVGFEVPRPCPSAVASVTFLCTEPPFLLRKVKAVIPVRPGGRGAGGPGWDAQGRRPAPLQSPPWWAMHAGSCVAIADEQEGLARCPCCAVGSAPLLGALRQRRCGKTAVLASSAQPGLPVSCRVNPRGSADLLPPWLCHHDLVQHGRRPPAPPPGAPNPGPGSTSPS